MAGALMQDGSQGIMSAFSRSTVNIALIFNHSKGIGVKTSNA